MTDADVALIRTCENLGYAPTNTRDAVGVLYVKLCPSIRPVLEAFIAKIMDDEHKLAPDGGVRASSPRASVDAQDKDAVIVASPVVTSVLMQLAHAAYKFVHADETTNRTLFYTHVMQITSKHRLHPYHGLLVLLLTPMQLSFALFKSFLIALSVKLHTSTPDVSTIDALYASTQEHQRLIEQSIVTDLLTIIGRVPSVDVNIE